MYRYCIILLLELIRTILPIVITKTNDFHKQSTFRGCAGEKKTMKKSQMSCFYYYFFASKNNFCLWDATVCLRELNISVHTVPVYTMSLS